MDKDFCLTGVKSGTKLNLQNVQREIENVTWERRKDTDGVFSQKYGSAINSNGADVPKFNFQQDSKASQRQIKIEATRASSKDIFSKTAAAKKPKPKGHHGKTAGDISAT